MGGIRTSLPAGWAARGRKQKGAKFEFPYRFWPKCTFLWRSGAEFKESRAELFYTNFWYNMWRKKFLYIIIHSMLSFMPEFITKHMVHQESLSLNHFIPLITTPTIEILDTNGRTAQTINKTSWLTKVGQGNSNLLCSLIVNLINFMKV